jgi:uncharacterized membrane protein YhhN
MNRTFTRIFGILICCAVTQTLVGYLGHSPLLVYIFKPLATILVLGIALANWISQKQNYALWICVGLFCSLAGDILLIWPDRLFAVGLGIFLLAHFAYLAAFTRDAKFPANWFIWLAFLALATAGFLVLKPNLPNGLALPVAVYSLVLATMAAQAVGRALRFRSSTARLAAIGAMFFLLSDTLLAWDRFHQPLVFPSVAILVPYYVAQVLFALSTKIS